MRWRNHEEKIGVPVEKGSAKVADLARPVLVSQLGTRKVYRSRGLMRCLRRLMAWEVNRADDPDGWYYEMLHMELGR